MEGRGEEEGFCRSGIVECACGLGLWACLCECQSANGQSQSANGGVDVVSGYARMRDGRKDDEMAFSCS